MEKKREFSLLLLFSIIALVVLPSVLAYSWGGYGYYQSPLQYLDNEWVMFSIIMLVFFAIIYYTVNKTFNNNVVSGVIALAVSLLIAITVTRRGMLYGYAGDELGSWIMIATAAIGLGFLIKFAYEGFGVIGSTATVIAFWLLLQQSDPYQILPYNISPAIINTYNFIASFFGLFILVVLAVVFAPFLRKKSPIELWTNKLFKPH